MVKAIFLDVDGTLISFNTHCVPQSAIEALAQAHEAGCRLIISTGRAMSDLGVIDEVKYDAVIALNGSDCVLRDGTSVSRRQISLDDFHKALALAQEYDFPIAVETDNGIFVNRVNPVVEELARIVAHPVPPVVDIEKEFIESQCCQLCFYCDLETEARVMAQLPTLQASRWHPIFADINVKGVSKATGIGIFANYYGIDIAETMAFGDGGNDVPMLKTVGTGVAMGNAADEIKSVADYVTTSVDDDGIKNALLHFGIIK